MQRGAQLGPRRPGSTSPAVQAIRLMCAYADRVPDRLTPIPQSS